MATRPVSNALDAWREAERRWEATDVADPAFRANGIAVVAAWLRYHDLLGDEPGSFVLVADDDHSYVAVCAGVAEALGYEPRELLGRRIEDIAAADLVESTPGAWEQFLSAGRQDGEFRLVASDGREVAMTFQARAHYPIAGFHTSRLSRVEAAR